MKKIYFLTRTNADLSIPYYLRFCKLTELFKKAFGQDVEIENFYRNTNKIKRVFVARKLTKSFLKSKAKNAEIIVVCGLDDRSTNMVKKYCLKNNVTIYIDVVEKADKKEKSLGCLSPSLIMNHRLVDKVITKGCKVLTISHYFEDYFNNKGIETVYVPNLYSKNYDNSEFMMPVSFPLTFSFVGYPHKKDSLHLIIEAMLKLLSYTVRRWSSPNLPESIHKYLGSPLKQNNL